MRNTAPELSLEKYHPRNRVLFYDVYTYFVYHVDCPGGLVSIAKIKYLLRIRTYCFLFFLQPLNIVTYQGLRKVPRVPDHLLLSVVGK